MRTEIGIKGSTDANHEGDGKGRRDIDDALDTTDAQTFRQAAGTGLHMSIDRPSLQFAISVVMSGMSELKEVHQLLVVRVSRYVLQHPGETWLFNYQADPKTLYVSTDTESAADELTRKSVSCTVERSGSHMLDCSVARHCQGRGDTNANLTDHGADRDATGGDHCIRQQCSTRNVHQDGIWEGATSCNQRVVNARSVSQEGLPVGAGGHVVELG